MSKIVKCSAELDNNIQIENLCQCIKIIGGTPIVNGNIVEVITPYSSSLAYRLVLLYESYAGHDISVYEE